MSRPITVRVIKDWDFPDWRRMSPGGTGIWDDIYFTDEQIENPDYVLVLNQPSERIEFTAPPNRVWAVIQEPPTKFHGFLHRGQRGFSRIYTTDTNLTQGSERYRQHYPVLSWHIMRSFDELAAMASIPLKNRDLAWITSSLSFLPGHRLRMEFLSRIREMPELDLFGRGLRPIDDKWDGLAPYRYSIVFENFAGPDYWSEKLSDCFLAGTMPIYFGCTNLESYFPRDSFIRFDPTQPNPTAALRKIIESSLAEDHRESLIEARRRCLYEYQMFPFAAAEIAADRLPPASPTTVSLRRRKLRQPVLWSQAIWHWRVLPLLRNLGIK